MLSHILKGGVIMLLKKSVKFVLFSSIFLFSASFISLAQNQANVGATGTLDSIKVEKQAIRPPVEGVFNSPGGKKKHIYKRAPTPLTPIREADGMWTKIVYQYIDVKEKINQSLYYPTEQKGDRISLYMLMRYATNTDTILVKQRLKSMQNLYGQEMTLETPLVAYTDEFLDFPLTRDETLKSFGYQKPQIIYDLESGLPRTDTVAPKITEVYKSDNIIGYEFKEQWVFDKQRSVLDNTQIIAIRAYFRYEKDKTAPVVVEGAPPAAKEEEDDEGDWMYDNGPWIYFKELRFFTANADVFNSSNSAECRSFDDIFLKRRFTSVIKQDENEKNNRQISDYTLWGLDQVLASEKMKDDIRKFEHDLWEF